MSSPACAEDRAVECRQSGREKDRQGSGQTGPAPSRTTDHRAEDRGPGQGLRTSEVGKPRTFHRGSEGSGGLEPLPSAVWASRPRTTSWEHPTQSPDKGARAGSAPPLVASWEPRCCVSREFVALCHFSSGEAIPWVRNFTNSSFVSLIFSFKCIPLRRFFPNCWRIIHWRKGRNVGRGLAPELFSEPNVGSPAPQHRQVLAPSFSSGLPTCPEGGTSPHCEQLETSPLFCGDNWHPAEHVPDKPLQGLACSVPKA